MAPVIPSPPSCSGKLRSAAMGCHTNDFSRSLMEFTPSASSARTICYNGWSFGDRVLQSNRKLECRSFGGNRYLYANFFSCATSITYPMRCQMSSGLSANLASGVGNARQSRKFGGVRMRQLRLQQWRKRVKEDDFEVDDDGGFDAVDMAAVDADEEENFTDYEPEYEAPVGYEIATKEADSFINTEGEIQETVVDWKINEDEFHKINLFTCDFFIRKVPDPDDNVYDFREMYVTPPDTDVYSTPKVHCKLPRTPIRCYWSNHEYIHTTEPPVDEPRAPLAKTEYEVMKVFLMRHLSDKRAKDRDFCLDFEEIYVIDTQTKSLSRADVQVKVPGGKTRDRMAETLIVRDDGTTFYIVPEGEERTPDEIIHTLHWDRTRENMENYLRGFRDYEISNWF